MITQQDIDDKKAAEFGPVGFLVTIVLIVGLMAAYGQCAYGNAMCGFKHCVTVAQ